MKLLCIFGFGTYLTLGSLQFGYWDFFNRTNSLVPNESKIFQAVFAKKCLAKILPSLLQILIFHCFYDFKGFAQGLMKI